MIIVKIDLHKLIRIQRQIMYSNTMRIHILGLRRPSRLKRTLGLPRVMFVYTCVD